MHDKAKCLEANANLSSDLFVDYYVSEDIEGGDCIQLRLNIHVLLECLAIFGK